MASQEFINKKNELEEKYAERIGGISEKNGVDMGVAFEMLKTNVLQGTNYEGGGVCTEAEWAELGADFADFRALYRD